VNAESSDIEAEFWRVLNALNPAVPQLDVMRSQSRDVPRELEQALRNIDKPALYVIDNIPEAAPGAAPPPMSRFCPALAPSPSSPRRGRTPSKKASEVLRSTLWNATQPSCC